MDFRRLGSFPGIRVFLLFIPLLQSVDPLLGARVALEAARDSSNRGANIRPDGNRWLPEHVGVLVKLVPVTVDGHDFRASVQGATITQPEVAHGTYKEVSVAS